MDQAPHKQGCKRSDVARLLPLPIFPHPQTDESIQRIGILPVVTNAGAVIYERRGVVEQILHAEPDRTSGQPARIHRIDFVTQLHIERRMRIDIAIRDTHRIDIAAGVIETERSAKSCITP